MNTNAPSRQFLETLNAKAGQFEARLARFLQCADPVPNLHDGLRYSLGLDEPRGGRGKRLRPVLALLTCEALGGDERDALPFALAIELMHNFALVHDDIEDGDTMRRGRPAVWKRYGLAHGVNIGDYLFCQVYRALLDGKTRLSAQTRLQLIELMTGTLDHTHRGQALDMNARQLDRISVEQYLQIVREKTGYYLAAPILGGAIAAGADPALHAPIIEYGSQLGPLFQIRDDLIDLTSGKGREQRGADIREGKRSFLVAAALENCAADEAQRLLVILNKPRPETSNADVDQAAALFERCGAVQRANEYCAQLRQACLRAIEPCPPELKHLLHQVTEYLAGRET